MGVAKEEVRHAVTINHRRTQAAGGRVDKATTLPGHWAIGFGGYERSNQAQEKVMSFDSQRFLAAQEAVYDQVVEELSQGQKTTHWIWFVFPQLTGLGRSECSISLIQLQSASKKRSSSFFKAPSTWGRSPCWTLTNPCALTM